MLDFTVLRARFASTCRMDLEPCWCEDIVLWFYDVWTVYTAGPVAVYLTVS